MLTDGRVARISLQMSDVVFGAEGAASTTPPAAIGRAGLLRPQRRPGGVRGRRTRERAGVAVAGSRRRPRPAARRLRTINGAPGHVNGRLEVRAETPRIAAASARVRRATRSAARPAAGRGRGGRPRARPPDARPTMDAARGGASRRRLTTHGRRNVRRLEGTRREQPHASTAAFAGAMPRPHGPGRARPLQRPARRWSSDARRCRRALMERIVAAQEAFYALQHHLARRRPGGDADEAKALGAELAAGQRQARAARKRARQTQQPWWQTPSRSSPAAKISSKPCIRGLPNDITAPPPGSR